MAFFRKILIRTVLPITWRHSRHILATRLLRFAVTESDSGWQILNALQAVDDPKVRAMVLQHALEEIHHASEFTRASKPWLAELPARPLPERDPLFEMEEGVDGLVFFLAYAHVGELDVFDQFASYAAGVGAPEVADVFLEAKLDEYGHISLTWTLLTSLVDEKRARREVLKVRGRRVYEAWLRFSKGIGDVSFAVLLSTLYLVFGPLLWLPARARLRWRGPQGVAA